MSLWVRFTSIIVKSWGLSVPLDEDGDGDLDSISSKFSSICRQSLYGRPDSMHLRNRDSTWIGFATHLERVETTPFGLGGHAISDRVFDHAEKRPRQSEHHHHVHHNADQL